MVDGHPPQTEPSTPDLNIDVIKRKKKPKPQTKEEQRNQEQLKKIEVLKNIAIAAAESVYNYKLIARSIGRDEDTLIKWRAADTDFADKLEEARVRFLEKNIRASRPEFLLERLEPDIFKERKHVEGDQTITIVTRKHGEQPKATEDAKPESDD